MHVGVVDHKGCQIIYSLTGNEAIGYSAHAKITLLGNKQAVYIPIQLDRTFDKYMGAEDAIIALAQNFIDKYLIHSTEEEHHG